MKKYSIFTLIKYTPKSKDLSPYNMDTKKIKDRVMSNIKGNEYVNQTITTNDVIKESQSIEMTAERPSKHGIGKLLIIVCSCILIVSSGIFVGNNQVPLTGVGDSNTYTTSNENIIKDKSFLHWLEFPKTATLDYNIYFNGTNNTLYQGSIELNEEDLDYINGIITKCADWIGEDFNDATNGETAYNLQVDETSYNFSISYKNSVGKDICVQILPSYKYLIDVILSENPINETDTTNYYYDNKNIRQRELLSYLEGKIQSTITYDTQNKLFGLFSIPSNAIIHNYTENDNKDYIQSIDNKCLITLNDSLNYSEWQQIDIKPTNHPTTVDSLSINFYGEDGKYTIYSEKNRKYITIRGTLYNDETVSYYYDTKNDNIYDDIQEILNKNTNSNDIFLGQSI